MRLKNNQIRHDSGVLTWANELVRLGWSLVYADLPGKAKPPMIGGYVPDVYAQHGVQAIIIEVETSDSVDTSHTKDQLAAFSRWKSAVPTGRQFLVKVV